MWFPLPKDVEHECRTYTGLSFWSDGDHQIWNSGKSSKKSWQGKEGQGEVLGMPSPWALPLRAIFVKATGSLASIQTSSCITSD